MHGCRTESERDLRTRGRGGAPSSRDAPSRADRTGFIAGVTIVFGIVALGVVEALLKPDYGEGLAAIRGAPAFAVGLVSLIVGRTELFTENFFDPVAVAIQREERGVWIQLGRLWLTLLVLNLVRGLVLTAIMTVPGALPSGSAETLVAVAEGIAAKTPMAILARAVMAGALITRLFFLSEAVGRADVLINVGLAGSATSSAGSFCSRSRTRHRSEASGTPDRDVRSRRPLATRG